MGIEKTNVLDTGVNATYHRIDAIAARFDGTGPEPFTTHVEVSSYLNKAAADAGKKPFSRQTLTVTGDTELNRAAIYSWLTAPIEYEDVQETQVVVVGGIPIPQTVTVQRPTAPVTGFNGATMV